MTSRRSIVRISIADTADPGIAMQQRPDELTVEAPLNLVLEGDVIATLMRTPGHDVELAAGWLLVESGVRSATDVLALRQCRTDDDPARADDVADTGRGVAQVHLKLADDIAPPRPRAWITSASCGVCSADVLDLSPLRWSQSAPCPPNWSVSAQVLLALPDAVRLQQRAFDRTGSLHAAALACLDGSVLVVREDVGRHNAVDKVTGWALLDGRVPAAALLLSVSGRVSFEIVQKAVAAGVAGIVAVSGPSDLAVDLAREHGLLLVGMIRPGRMNVYACSERIQPN